MFNMPIAFVKLSQDTDIAYIKEPTTDVYGIDLSDLTLDRI